MQQAQRTRVLVVDNEDIVRMVIARMLRDRGFDVVEAANGRVALDLLAASPTAPFDLILTNSRLPGVPGDEFVRQVRDRYPEIRLLHLTGHGEDARDRRIEAMGVPTVIKPFDQRQLVEAIEQSLTGS
jgi:two-component system cell cycle sensor histidine kinase/response regulator CckA